MRRFLLFAATLFLCVPAIWAAVLGIDFGGEYIKACVVAPGSPFKILLDEHSKRKYPNIIAFDAKERKFGNNGITLLSRKPQYSYSFFRQLLGQPVDSPLVSDYQALYLPHSLTPDPVRGTLYHNHMRAEAGLSDIQFSPEELVAMVLEYVKNLASADGNTVTDAVIAVPAYFTQRHRQAILDAAEIAGLRVMALINENTAAALQYAIHNQIPLEKKEIIAFYNMGSTKTEVTLAEFSSYLKSKRDKIPTGQFQVLSHASDPTLGGQIFDKVVLEILADEFNDFLREKSIFSKDDDIRNFPRPMAKLKKAAQKAKEVLSANKEAFVNIEGLHEDVDFRSKITRDQLYSNVDDAFLTRVVAPLKSALKGAKLKKSDLNAMVLIGGSTRVHKIRETLDGFFHTDLSHNLNSDEAPALGAAFRAANLSALFRVRTVGMTEVAVFPVGIRLSDLAEQDLADVLNGVEPFTKRATLYSANKKIGKRKSVSFTHDRDFYISMQYDTKLVDGTSPQIGGYKVTGLAEFAKNNTALGTPKVSLSFLMDDSSMLRLVRAEASVSEEVEVRIKKKKEKKDKKGDDTKDKTTEKDKKEKKKDEKTDSETEKSDDTTKTTEDSAKKSDDSPDKSSDSEKSPEEFETKMEKRDKKFALKFEFVGGDLKPMTTDEIESAREKLRAFTARDRETQQIAEALNNLETYIFQARETLDSPRMEEVASEDERQKFREALSNAEDSLYEDVSGATAATYADRLAALGAQGAPMFTRLSELDARPKAVADVVDRVTTIRETLVKLKEVPDWIPGTEMDKFESDVTAFEEWLKAVDAKQAKQSPKSMPVFLSKDIYDKYTPIHKTIERFVKRPKPVPKPKNATETTDAGEKSAETASDEAASDETATDEMVGGETATDETAGGEAASDETATDEAASDEAASDETVGDEATGGETATEESDPDKEDGSEGVVDDKAGGATDPEKVNEGADPESEGPSLRTEL
eukprot:216384_1